MEEGSQRHEPKESNLRPVRRPDGAAHRSELGKALDRAGTGISVLGAVGSEPELLQENTIVSDPEEFMSEPAERTTLRKVTVKHEIAGYIDHCFTCRTTEDGTVLSVSKETLVEDLTRLVMEVIDRRHEETRLGRQ